MLSNVSTLFRFLPNIDWFLVLRIILIIVIGFAVAWFIRILLFKSLVRILPVKLSKNITRIVYYIIVFLVLISALGAAGVDLTGLLVAGGIVGIILGFALQNTVANLFSGLFLQWEKPFKVGDPVKIGNFEGVIMDIGIMSTKIRQFNGVITRIPNYTVFQSEITNYTASPVRRAEFRVGIAYREDAEKAYQVIRKVLDEHPLVLVYPEPDVFVTELGSSSVDILVRVWVPSQYWIMVVKELLWKIKKAISDAGIEIPFIQNDVWFRSPLKVEVVGNMCSEKEKSGTS
ncbi:MAG: mechanosensitive ion channel family protein [Thermoprotei archaeon]